jgi:[DsrC]-trisulfide reductase subunit J
MADRRRIFIGLVLFAALVTAPAWLGAARPSRPLELARPSKAKQCVEATAFMRARHMELLDGWRDAVVRRAERVYVASDGRRHEISLTRTCLGCHEEPEKFCDRCHAYAGVEALCWDCHRKKRPAAVAALQEGAP